MEVEGSLKAEAITRIMDRACEQYGTPAHIRSDNGPEFIADAIREWVKDRKINTLYIEPGSPWQNPYVESFHSRFRNECLNREIFLNLLDAKIAVADWQQKYNERRPHTKLKFQSPAEVFHAQGTPSFNRMGALPPNPRDLSHYSLPADASAREAAGSTKLPNPPFKHDRGCSGCIPAEPYPSRPLDNSNQSFLEPQTEYQPWPTNI